MDVKTSGKWTPVTVTDDFGYSVTVDKEPVRIISLAPTNTEILYALGLGNRIVGVTEYCNYPEDALTKPTIGGYTTVNVERVVAQKPDLVFAYYGNGIDTVDHLKQLGIKVITLNSDSINGTFKDIEMVGKTTGKVDEAKALTDDMRSKIEATVKKLEGITYRPTTFHCVWADPIWVSGGNTFEDELIKMAGGENCFADVDGWGIVTLERLLTTDPDIIIVDSGVGMGEDGFDAVKQSLYSDKRTSQLKAVKNNQVYVVSADLMDRGGPRISETLDILATIYHPTEMGKSYSDGSSGVATPGFSVVSLVLGALAALFIARR